jgi:protein disulfide-isomerase
MRPSVFALFGAAALAQAATTKKKQALPTVFNDVTVPPMIELTPSNWETEIAKSRWLMIKHYSPYCPHCQDFAPIYQTLYEFYYTSTPPTTDAEDVSFGDYYDFRFGSINCIAYYDLCQSHGVQSYPLTILYEEGQQADQIKGVKNLTMLSELVETALEKTKPGSRPALITLPEVGDDVAPGFTGSKSTDASSSDKNLAKDSVLADDKVKLTTQDGEKEKPLGKPSSDEVKGSVSEKKGAEKPSKDSPKSDKPYKPDWNVPTSGELEKEKKPKKPLMSPNPSGTSVSLTPENFQRLVTMTQDPWFIKFYAPWCPHCQAMGPTWEQLAKNMRGKLNIGEVNCDKERRLCKEVHANSYPTLLFFKGGERAEYQGLRGLGDFIQYAESAMDLANGVPDVDAKELAAMEKKDEVIFVYFYDHATTSEDFAALERLPLNLIGHAKLVKTSDPALYDRFKITTWPRLLVSREGRPTYYTPLTPNEMRNEKQVLTWMKSVWLPLVPEMTASNARQIMDGKIVVLGVLNRDNQDAYQSAIREMKSAANEWMDRQIQEFQLERKKLRDAKQMRIEEAEDRNDERGVRNAKAIRIDMEGSGKKEVSFAWVDGTFWQRWIRTTYGVDVKDGERVIINDQDRRRYWDTTATGNYILVSRTSIMETLDKIVYGPHVIRPKLTVSIIQKIFIDIREIFYDHPYLSIGFLAAFMLSSASWYRNRIRRSRGGHFRLDDSLGIRDFKDGLLGHHNGNTKAD